MDYVKNQKEAIAIVKQMVADGHVAQDIAEKYFPELKESKDMIMVKFIKNQLFNIKKTITENYELDTKLTKAIDWLEKQGEHANFRNKIQIGDKVTRNEDGVLVNLSQLNRVAKKDEKQGEQKPADKVEPKFKVGDEIRTKNEESLTITRIDRWGYWSEDLFICGFDEECKWELVEQKPAWSEEDEKIWSQVINEIEAIKSNSSTVFEKNIAQDKIDWLKSLKERYTWKPSDAQMASITCAVRKMKESACYDSELVSLLNDLKKLKVE